ncbi:hypothetical protein HPB49_015364 [Dermacentor silvarum]|uniref:Uncharacterized protein n=1 Tax=Dermacentor silvarum TaxID=543639 RepID=A0ACB8CRU7_DERSI|nr:hypothetical protein HPB49_015364 [Dermacentor silvarum]
MAQPQLRVEIAEMKEAEVAKATPPENVGESPTVEVPMDAYCERKYAHNSELYPECIEQRTRVDQILYSVACSIRPHHITFFHRRFGDNSKPTEEEQADFEEKVLGGIQCLIGQGPFAAGDTLTVAVLSILAFLALSLDIDYVNSVRFPDLFEYCERVKGALSYFDDVYGSTIRLYRRIWAQLQ